jgi:hypothetical protein
MKRRRNVEGKEGGMRKEEGGRRTPSCKGH